MALEHALLVSLAERASSGYELTRRFEKSIGRFWTATHQQIYKVLARMQASGWVHSTVVVQEGRPDKKVYDITAAGRAELRRWLAAPARPDNARSELAVKVRAASFGDAAAVLADVARQREEHRQRLAYYLANEAEEFGDPDALRGQALHQYLVLRGGIALERTLIEWCDEVLTALGNDDEETT